MPRKNVLEQSHILVAQSMASNFNSPPIGVKYLDNIMIQLICTGSPTGTFALQASNDYNPLFSPDTSHWDNLPLSGTPSLSGSADDIQIQITQIAAPYIRLAYTASSGTGTCDLWIAGKEV